MDDRQPVLSRTGFQARPAHAAPAPLRSRLVTRWHGHSLLELSFTLGISATILLTLYGFLMTQGMVSLEESTELSMQNSVRVGAQQLLDELEMCKPKRLDSMGAWFEYYLPKTTASGGYELDSTGNLIWGVSDGVTWYPNGFYCVTFIRSNEPTDFLDESKLHYNTGTVGCDLNGNGSATDVFIGGFLSITAFDVNGMPIGQPRMLTGKFFMQLDPTTSTGAPTAPVLNVALNYENVDSLNLSVFPTMGNGDPTEIAQLRLDRLQYKGAGIFLMRQVNGVGCQQADPFIDSNGNGIRDNTETYIDANGNGQYDEADCEPFIDANGNNVHDTSETYVDSNHNGKFDCRMTLHLTTFNPGRTVNESGLDRDKAVQLKVLYTKIRFKNF